MTPAPSSLTGKQILERAFIGLEEALPERMSRAVRWLHRPESRWCRIPLGLLLVAASTLWFLPVIGLEWLPFGLLLIAQDTPPLRHPVGLVILWLLALWKRLRAFLQRRGLMSLDKRAGPPT